MSILPIRSIRAAIVGSEAASLRRAAALMARAGTSMTGPPGLPFLGGRRIAIKKILGCKAGLPQGDQGILLLARQHGVLVENFDCALVPAHRERSIGGDHRRELDRRAF